MPGCGGPPSYSTVIHSSLAQFSRGDVQLSVWGGNDSLELRTWARCQTPGLRAVVSLPAQLSL